MPRTPCLQGSPLRVTTAFALKPCRSGILPMFGKFHAILAIFGKMFPAPGECFATKKAEAEPKKRRVTPQRKALRKPRRTLAIFESCPAFRGARNERRPRHACSANVRVTRTPCVPLERLSRENAWGGSHPAKRCFADSPLPRGGSLLRFPFGTAGKAAPARQVASQLGQHGTSVRRRCRLHGRFYLPAVCGRWS